MNSDVEIWSDEETPTTIYNAEEFVDYLTNSEKPDDYILMADFSYHWFQHLAQQQSFPPNIIVG